MREDADAMMGAGQLGNDNNPEPQQPQPSSQQEDLSGLRQPDQQHMQQLIGGPEPDFNPDLPMHRMPGAFIHHM